MSDTPENNSPTQSWQDMRVTAITEGILGSLRESGCKLRSSAFSYIVPWVRKAMEPTTLADSPTPDMDEDEHRTLDNQHGTLQTTPTP